jgi:hypothetical protein
MKAREANVGIKLQQMKVANTIGLPSVPSH